MSTVAHPLQISVIGNVAVRYQGIPVGIKSRKSLAVIAYMALSESGLETRERLVGLLWSETEEQKARASLRQTLRELRRCFLAVGYGGLTTEKLAIELPPLSVQVDLFDVLRAAEAHQVHPKLLETPRLTDHLLANLDDIDPSFRAWVLAKRQTINERLLRALEDGLRNSDADPNAKRLIAEGLISLDSTHEEACRDLMRARAAEGDVAAALRIYKTLWDLLDEEYGMEPSARTQQLIAEIKQGAVEAPTPPLFVPASQPHAAPDDQRAPGQPMPHPFTESHVATLRLRASRTAPRKIALLVSSFQINGIPPERVHIVHGFRHHLIASLIRFREWSVVDGSEHSADVMHDQVDPAQYSIDATAYETGQSANVVLTLRHNETNTFVWSETFELRLENWFGVQQRVVRRITTSLNVQLSAERLMRLAPEPDVSLEVYDRWLRGQEMIFSFNPNNWKRAAQIFADVIRDAPNFSSSYNSLVQLNNTMHFVHPGIFRDLAKAKETVSLARTAVQLDPVDFRAQLHLGWSLALVMQHSEAEVHMDLACDLNPNDPWTLISAGAFYAFAGKFEPALKLTDDSFALSPAPGQLQWAYRAIIQFLCGNYEDALHAAEQSNDIVQTLGAWKAATLHCLGRSADSVLAGERFLDRIRSAWIGSEPPTNANIVRWTLHAHPIGPAQHWQRLKDGVEGAGLSAAGLRHQRW